MTHHAPYPPPHRKGFTLIELSIVLVIIGLIVGGVLVGRDLIHGAELRKQIGQFEKYDTYVETFKGKFNYLPGDLPQNKAAQLGFTARNAPTAGGQSNGDDVIEGCGAAIGSNTPGMEQSCETLLFWNDLSSAGLIAGSFTTAVATPAYNENAYTQSQIPSVLPPAVIGDGNYVMITSIGGIHSWLIAQVLNIHEVCCSTAIASVNYSITPVDALAMDSKIDDGLPQTGRVTARGVPSWGQPATTGLMQGPVSADNTCAQLFSNTYSSKTTPYCILGFRTAW